MSVADKLGTGSSFSQAPRGRSARGRAKAVTQAVNGLCGRLRPHARTLVDGFGIPEPWLACPLLDGEGETGTPAQPLPEDEPTGLASVG